MAKIYEKDSQVNDKYKRYLTIGLISAAIGLVILILNSKIGYYSHQRVFELGNILEMVFFATGAFFVSRSMKYRAGAKGKDTTLNLLKQLPDSYRVVTNPSVEFEGKKTSLTLL